MDREHILELKDKIKTLQTIVNEGEDYLNFKKSAFYSILERTLKAQMEVYKQEAYKASKSNLSNMGNFLGRMEEIDDFYDILEKFELNASEAQSQIDLLTEQIKEEERELNEKDSATLDSGGSMG